jgi:phosphatidylinositol kinase/protein kinase (PI-3  family)
MIQEETSQYYMNDVLEFCLQKKGYDPEISYSIYEEEAKKYSQEIISYDSIEIKEKVFYKMCHILPVNSFKSFVHKFITSADDIFVFRKQFATSYGLNSILGYIFLESIKLNNISFNKETGSCAFHDIKYLQFKDRKMDHIRLTKNIS